MAYEKFDPDKVDMLSKAIEFNGNISSLAQYYKVCRETMYQYLKRDPQGKAIIQQVRGYNTEFDLDLAEKVVRKNMENYEQNPGLAQRAAEKIIDRKGHLRGYVMEAQVIITDEQKAVHDDTMSLLDHLQSKNQSSQCESQSPPNS